MKDSNGIKAGKLSCAMLSHDHWQWVGIFHVDLLLREALFTGKSFEAAFAESPEECSASFKRSTLLCEQLV